MIKWTPKSQEDLELIMEHIAKNFGIDLAVTTVFGMVDYIETTLSKNPLMGTLLESNPLFSKIVYEGNSVFYCENPKDKNIYIVYVRPRGTRIDYNRINNEEIA